MAEETEYANDDSVFGNSPDLPPPATMAVPEPERRASVTSASSEDSTDKLIKSLESNHLGDGVTTLDKALAEAEAKQDEANEVEKEALKPSVSVSQTSTKNEYDGMIIHKIERKPEPEPEPVSEHVPSVDPLKAADGKKNSDDNTNTINISGSKKAGTYPTPPMKKPVKFRVTSVNSEPVHSRSTSTGSQSGESSLPIAISTSSGTYIRKLLMKTNISAEEATTQRLIKETQQKYDIFLSKIVKIEKEIHFLTNLLPPYNVEIDYPTRVKISRAIEKLQMKQDELDKNKYSLGIQLSRLWRDHEDGDLWVRSVTNQ
ncbi:uncharacterized protein KQ657_001252 [Scheffersomyces spartinae]|uniref:Uncharacterized protein n=1 Tax=Scheffersomyces spartinae TaxID=45513 RepID=A0A9P7V7V3_9ASCO|nr:uncharacterized protein KQ657_001252 [Scheffersomyces spartinae]KAG7192797.1 hypothetical protein KQ657_001252 [Scheffersomyces spartinae]